MAGRGPPLSRRSHGGALASTRGALLTLFGSDRLGRIVVAPDPMAGRGPPLSRRSHGGALASTRGALLSRGASGSGSSPRPGGPRASCKSGSKVRSSRGRTIRLGRRSSNATVATVQDRGRALAPQARRIDPRARCLTSQETSRALDTTTQSRQRPVPGPRSAAQVPMAEDRTARVRYQIAPTRPRARASRTRPVQR